MNRRTLLQFLAASPLAFLFPGLKKAEAVNIHDYWLKGSVLQPLDPVETPFTPKKPLEGFELTLHVWESETEFCIAASAQDAVKVFQENTGPWVADHDMPGLHAEDWSRWPPHRPFQMTEEISREEYDRIWPRNGAPEPIDIAGGMMERELTYRPPLLTSRIIALPRWWAANRGRGLLASWEG